MPGGFSDQSVFMGKKIDISIFNYLLMLGRRNNILVVYLNLVLRVQYFTYLKMESQSKPHKITVRFWEEDKSRVAKKKRISPENMEFVSRKLRVIIVETLTKMCKETSRYVHLVGHLAGWIVNHYNCWIDNCLIIPKWIIIDMACCLDII